VLLKLSGETLMGDQPYGVDPTRVEAIAREVTRVRRDGAETALVIEAGNIHRGLRDRRTHADPGGQIMVRYFYAWTPLVIVATVVLLSLPWLSLIALVIVSLVALAALAALAWAIVSVPLLLSRSISRRWHIRTGASPRTAAALSPARHQSGPSGMEHRRQRQH
jgi:hypothetical protein